MSRVDSNARRGQRLAALLQGALNDLKRDRATAAQELDLTRAQLDAALRGEWTTASMVRERMVERWPVSERDLAPLVDDTERGVLVRTRCAARLSSRVLSRGGAPYYEYRDVAMNPLSPIRPEWIRMLAETGALDPHDPALRWNEGHALHQLTYFRGPVDFYVEAGGRRLGYAMEEGDSAFIPSFLPHTFATRDPSAKPHILAVTFHGRIHGDVREELALLGPNALQQALRSRQDFGARLQSLLNEASVGAEELVRRTGLALGRIEELLKGGALEVSEAEGIARALRVSCAELLCDPVSTAPPVIVRRAESATWPFPSEAAPHYSTRALAHSDIAPRAHGMVLAAPLASEGPPIATGLHEFAYVLGPGDVRLRWRLEGEDHQQELRPGDSIYLPPWRAHSLKALEQPAEILIFRAPNALSVEVLDELIRCEPRAQARFVAPESAWYQP